MWPGSFRAIGFTDAEACVMAALGTHQVAAKLELGRPTAMGWGGRGEGDCISKLRFLAAVVSPLSLLILLLLLPLPKLSWRPCQCQPTKTEFAIARESEDWIIHTGPSDVAWLQQQVLPLSPALAGANDGAWMMPRKGINPRPRQQQLFDLRRFHGISHYENGSRISIPVHCPQALLVEPHHSYYGEPWSGGRDVFEFLTSAVSLQPHHRVLEIGCGTLRVGLHFIRFLHASHFFCLEQDALSLAAALLYELPANGLLWKRPSLLLGEDVLKAGELLLQGPLFELVYASAVFLHMPDGAVWKSVEVLGKRLAVPNGRLFVSHNMKFCTRLSRRGCEVRLREAGLLYVGKQTHDSLLFNHFEVWHEFRCRSHEDF